MPPLLVTHSADEHAAYACGRLELALGLLLIVGIVSWRRRSGRCIRPEAVGQEASPHPAGQRKQTKTHKLQEVPSTPQGSLVNTIGAMLGHSDTTRHQTRTQ